MYYKRNHLRITVAFFIILTMMGCEPKNPVKDVVDDPFVEVNYQPLSTVISGIFVNAATGETIDDRTIHVTLEGRDNDLVVDLSGDAQKEFEIDDGLLTCGLPETIKPSSESPVQFSVIAKAEGYLPTSKTIDVFQAGGESFTMHMVQFNHPPEGVAVAYGTGEADATGAVKNSIEATASETMTGAYGSITIPEGTVLKDASGTPLTGQIKATIVYHNNQSEASLLSFPGGFSVTTYGNDMLEEGIFISGGFMSIEIRDESGKLTKTFGSTTGNALGKSANTNSDSLPEVTIQIPAGTINPETGAPVQAGDTIGLWSLEPDVNIWDDEGTCVIQGPDENGHFFVSFKVKHLSYWNLDWKGRRCSTGITVKIVGKEKGVPILLKLVRRGGGFIRSRTVCDNEVTFRNAPQNLPVTLYAYYRSDNVNPVLVGQIDIDNLCDSGPVTLVVTLPGEDPPVELTFNVSGYCPCSQYIIVRPTGFPIYYVNTENISGMIYAGIVQDGQITIKGLIGGQTYQFWTFYKGSSYTTTATVYSNYAVYVPGLSSNNIKEVKIDGTTISYKIELPQVICDELCPSE